MHRTLVTPANRLQMASKLLRGLQLTVLMRNNETRLSKINKHCTEGLGKLSLEAGVAVKVQKSICSAQLILYLTLLILTNTFDTRSNEEQRSTVRNDLRHDALKGLNPRSSTRLCRRLDAVPRFKRAALFPSKRLTRPENVAVAPCVHILAWKKSSWKRRKDLLEIAWKTTQKANRTAHEDSVGFKPICNTTELAN